MKLMLTLAAATVLVMSADSVDAGWFKKATGIRTPEPVRKIAPKGVQLPQLMRRAPETSSVLGVEPFKVATIQLTNQTGAPITVAGTAYPSHGSPVSLPQRTLQPDQTAVWSGLQLSSVSRLVATAYSPGSGNVLKSWNNVLLSQQTHHTPSRGADPGGTATVYSGVLTGYLVMPGGAQISGTYNSN